MKLNLKTELPLIGIVFAPFIYLFYIWDTLPEKVPTHWNTSGEIDDWGSKFSLFLLLFLLPVLTYLVTVFIPIIDPKNKINKMGGKFQQLKFGLVTLMSFLAIIIIYSSKNKSFSDTNLIYVPIGLLFMLLGNFFKVIQPNYFIGIKTPWTLESPEVWKLTHLLAGKIWIVGGLFIVFFTFIIDAVYFNYVFLSTIAFLVLIPTFYSYFKFKELKNQS